MKWLVFLICPFLLELLSLTSGKLHVVPLNKGGDKADLNNYWPTSKLPRLTKVLESIVNNHLTSFLSIYPVLSPQQSGFRAIIVLLLRSPPLLMILYLRSMKGNTELPSLWIWQKLSLDHSFLIQLSGDVGVDCSWFNDYLSHRQCVTEGNDCSVFLPLSREVL